MFIYPENLKAKPMLWLWLLRDIAVIGIGALLSVLALTQGLGMGLLVVTVLYAFLTIQVDGSSILTSMKQRRTRFTPKPADTLVSCQCPKRPSCSWNRWLRSSERLLPRLRLSNTKCKH